MADEVVRALRARTGIEHWLGACGARCWAARRRQRATAWRFWSWRCPLAAFRFLRTPGWPPRAACCCWPMPSWARPSRPRCWPDSLAMVRADTWSADLIAAGRSPVQIAERRDRRGAACLGFARRPAGGRRPCHRRLAAGSDPPRHQFAVGGEILALDGRPALEVMTEELGDLFRHSGRRFAPEPLGRRSARALRRGVEALRMRRIVDVDDRRRLAAGRGRPPRCRGAADAAGSRRFPGARARARPRRCRARLDGRAADRRHLPGLAPSRPRPVRAGAWTRSRSCARNWAGCR